MTKPMNTTSTVIPSLLYRDAAKAIEWLGTAFGFERRLVVPGENGGIAHAELSFGNGMIMLSSAGNGHFDAYQKTPAEVGGVGTQSAYVVVEDCDAHYARAIAAGAEILLDIVDQHYGGRGYTCRDPEGHVWSFGSFDPWA